MNVDSLIKVIGDSKDLTPRAFMLAVEAELALLVPFNHELSKATEACGINKEDIPDIEIQSKSTSEAVEEIETLLTKRELTYAFTKELQMDPMERLLKAMVSSTK